MTAPEHSGSAKSGRQATDSPGPAEQGPAGQASTAQAPAPAPTLAAEDVEWVEELTSTWVEVYKKSATTVALLRILRERGPLPAAEIAPLLVERTGWDFTERGLYRTLRRLAGAGVLHVQKVPVARTGAMRQDFDLTGVGIAYLEQIELQLI